jgi:hypothetical protein
MADKVGAEYTLGREMADLNQPTDAPRLSHLTFISKPRHIHLVQQQQEKNTSPWNTSKLMVMSVSKY